MAGEANDFLVANYGAEAAGINIGSSIFGEFSVLAQSDERYNIGTLKDDAGGKAITIKPDNVIIHAGVGNDVIKADANSAYSGDEGVRIIDGGEGQDTLDYSASAIGVSVVSDTLWKPTTLNLITGRNPDDTDHTIDHAFDVETIIGSDHRDIIIGNNDKNDSLEGGKGVDILFGRGGSDTIKGGDNTDGLSGGGAPAGKLDYLYGGGGQDIFEFNNKSMIMDAEEGDFISWAGATKQITGGVQQFWMEGNWAYYTPFSGIIAGGSSIGLLSDLLYAQSVLTDLAVGANFRFGLTESHQLLIQIGRGRAGNDNVYNLLKRAV